MKGPKVPAPVPLLFTLFWKTSEAKEGMDGFLPDAQSPVSGRLGTVVVKTQWVRP